MDQDESRELNEIMAPKQSNTSFIKSLKHVKSKVSTFSSKDQRQSSYRKHMQTTAPSSNTYLRRPREYPSHKQSENIVTNTRFSESHSKKLKMARISNERPDKIESDRFERLQKQKELEMLQLKLQKRRENARRAKLQRMNDSRLSRSSKKSVKSCRSLSNRSHLKLRRGRSANDDTSFRSSELSYWPRESRSQPNVSKERKSSQKL
jgi:hypothetical protein